jgi:non-specific serine/threonine protein kinase
MLETIRECGEEALVDGGEEDTARQRHVDWCLGITHDAPSPLRRVTQPVHLLRLEAEHANFRTALTWLDNSGRTVEFLRLAASLGYFWYLAGHEPEGLDWLHRALAKASDETTPEYIEALIRAGHLAQTLGDAMASEYLKKGRSLAQASSDIGQQAHAAVLLGIMAEDNGDYEEAESMLAIGREFAEQSGLQWAVVCADYHLGIVTYGQGESERACATIEAARTAAQAIDDMLIPTWSLDYLALIACEEGNLPHAASLLRQRQTCAFKTGIRRGDSMFLGAAAVLADALGKWESAARLLRASAAANHDVPFSLPERAA